MLAERESPGRSLPVRAALAVLALLVGLAGVVGATPSADALEPEATVQVVVVAPIVLPAGSAGLVDAELLAQYTAAGGALTRQLDAAVALPVALAIDPRIIASIRVLGSSAPPTATEWLARLAAAPNETFALAYADSDLTLATQSGDQGVLTPLSLEFAVDPALFAEAPQTTATPTPTATGDPTPPPLPTTESLLDWPYTLEHVAWPRANTVIGADLAAFETAGYETTILGSGNVTREGSVTSVATIGNQTILVSDDAASASLAAATRALTPVDWQAAMSQAYDAIAAAASAQSGSSATVVVVLDRTAPLANTRLADTIGDITTKLTLTSISDVLDDPAGAASVTDQPQPVESVTLVSRMLIAEQAEQRFAAAAADPAALIGLRRLALLAVLSNAWQPNPAGWMKAAEGYITTSLDIRDSVQVVQSSSLNFFADSASIPIAVDNSLNQAVTVYITVHPQTALLAVSDRFVELTIEPNSQGKGEVPVQAISNGTVRLTVTLTGPNGELIGTPREMKVNVQAGWETPIVLAVAILVVLVFGVGIIRNIVRRRRRVDADASGSDD